VAPAELVGLGTEAAASEAVTASAAPAVSDVQQL
jgi:hypothetical protein